MILYIYIDCLLKVFGRFLWFISRVWTTISLQCVSMVILISSYSSEIIMLPCTRLYIFNLLLHYVVIRLHIILARFCLRNLYKQSHPQKISLNLVWTCTYHLSLISLSQISEIFWIAELMIVFTGWTTPCSPPSVAWSSCALLLLPSVAQICICCSFVGSNSGLWTRCVVLRCV